MEKDQDTTKTLPSTSIKGGIVVINEDVVCAGSQPETTTIKIQGEAPAAVSREMKVFASEEQIRAVFSNNLISDNILSHLSFADMKAVRHVSRNFSSMILTYKRFTDSQVLLVTKAKSPFLSDLHSLLLLLDPKTRIWRGIKIDVTLPSELLQQTLPRHIMENVHFVSLVSEGFNKNKPTPVLAIRDVLSSTSKISHLQIDARLLERNLDDVFSCSAGCGNLTDLKKLDVTEQKDAVSSRFDLPRASRVQAFTANVSHLSSTLQSLESLSINLVFSFLEDYDQSGTPHVISKAVSELIQRNRETLRELSVHFDIWAFNKDLASVTLPRLKRLTAFTHGVGQAMLAEFLANHPYLEELDVVDVAVDRKLYPNLLDVIKQRSPSLRKLHLKIVTFATCVQKIGESVDWSFLGGMAKLKDFQLCWGFYYDYPQCGISLSDAQRNRLDRNWNSYQNVTRVLECLPRNQLESLSLRGIATRDPGLWNFNVFNREAHLASKLQLLRGFRNLRRLSFFKCPDAVNDDIMRFIVTEMTSLEELEVGHCDNLTDAGFAGTSEDGSDSIRNLKGLKVLSIRSCPSVTLDGLLSCLEMPFLRRLSYFSPARVSKSFVMQIVSQNPCLESLGVNVYGAASVILAEMNNPRLIKLTDLWEYDSDEYSNSENSDDDYNGPTDSD